MAGLRERQKESRKQNIMTASKELFLESGYNNTKIENIAEKAGVSGVTVHNYYETKAGVLMAIVAESDLILLETINKQFTEEPESLLTLFLTFSEVIRLHAINYLNKDIWREIIATSLNSNHPYFSRNYISLDHKLAIELIAPLEKLQEKGEISKQISPYELAKALFQLQNARFIQFICFENLSNEEVNELLIKDMNALLNCSQR